jgi:hypothetical protein
VTKGFGINGGGIKGGGIKGFGIKGFGIKIFGIKRCDKTHFKGQASLVLLKVHFTLRRL